jgi:protein-S-isoprenylcysteine O-methyltransferase Ste14
MKRFAFLLYGVIVYTGFFAAFLYLIGFVGNIIVPKGIDGPLAMPLWQALSINFGLVLLFAVQHSIMARGWFKKWWTKFVPEPIERSTYVLFTVIALVLLFVFWQPMGGEIWSIENGLIVGILWALFVLGWTILLVSTFLINHFDLFGLRQVWLNFRQKPYTHLKFRTPFFYKWIRHPLYFGFILAFWSAPEMSSNRFVLSILFTLYILKAIQWEEKDLITHFGETYKKYASRVPKILPTFSNKEISQQPTYETYIKGN